jgi:hypothetical protein
MPRSFFRKAIIAPVGGAYAKIFFSENNHRGSRRRSTVCGAAGGALYGAPILPARWARFGANLAHCSTYVLICQIGARAMHSA